MKAYKTEGIIIKRQNFGEADRLLTIYSKDFGKIKAIGKGVRRPLSKLSGHLELFYESDFVIAKGKNLDIINGAQTLNRFENIKTDELTLSAAYALGELIYFSLEDHEKNEKIYDLLVKTLKKINIDNVPEIVFLFELKLFQLLGYQPEVERCALCRGELVNDIYFDFQEGGTICKKCKDKSKSNIKISKNTVKLLRLAKIKSLETLQQIKLDDDLKKDLAGCTRSIRQGIIERDLKSLDIFK